MRRGPGISDRWIEGLCSRTRSQSSVPGSRSLSTILISLAFLLTSCAEAPNSTTPSSVTSTSTAAPSTTSAASTTASTEAEGPDIFAAADLDLAGGSCPIDEPMQEGTLADVQSTMPTVAFPDGFIGVTQGFGSMRPVLPGEVVGSTPWMDDMPPTVTIESEALSISYVIHSSENWSPGTEVDSDTDLAYGGSIIQIEIETIDGAEVDERSVLDEVGCTLELPPVDSITVETLNGTAIVHLGEPVVAGYDTFVGGRLTVDGVWVADVSLWYGPPPLGERWDPAAGFPERTAIHERTDGSRAESWNLTPGSCCAFLTFVELGDDRALAFTSSSPIEAAPELVASIDPADPAIFADERFAIDEPRAVVTLWDPTRLFSYATITASIRCTPNDSSACVSDAVDQFNQDSIFPGAPAAVTVEIVDGE